jgi:pre-mRNA-processing factor 39
LYVVFFFINSLFERAISTAGYDYRSDKLWDAFLEWEKSQGQLKKVTDIYDKLFTVPTQQYTQHFEK